MEKETQAKLAAVLAPKTMKAVAVKAAQKGYSVEATFQQLPKTNLVRINCCVYSSGRYNEDGHLLYYEAEDFDLWRYDTRSRALEAWNEYLAGRLEMVDSLPDLNK